MQKAMFTCGQLGQAIWAVPCCRANGAMDNNNIVGADDSAALGATLLCGQARQL